MSSNRKKKKKNFLVNREAFLAGIQGLSIFFQDKTNLYLQVRADLGDEHPASIQLRDELDALESILNFFCDLVKDQNVGNSSSYN